MEARLPLLLRCFNALADALHGNLERLHVFLECGPHGVQDSCPSEDAFRFGQYPISNGRVQTFAHHDVDTVTQALFEQILEREQIDQTESAACLDVDQKIDIASSMCFVTDQ